jgi:hypothetical protein
MQNIIKVAKKNWGKRTKKSRQPSKCTKCKKYGEHYEPFHQWHVNTRYFQKMNFMIINDFSSALCIQVNLLVYQAFSPAPHIPFTLNVPKEVHSSETRNALRKLIHEKKNKKRSKRFQTNYYLFPEANKINQRKKW